MTFSSLSSTLAGCALAFFVSACAGATDTTQQDAPPADGGHASTEPPPVPPGKAGDAGPAALEDAGKKKCNALVNVASPIAIVATNAPAAAASGGAIVDGTYVLTEATLHRNDGIIGPTGKSVKMTISISGNHAESVFDGVNRTATITAIGGVLASDTTCPQVAHDEVGYIATPTTLTTISESNNGPLVYVFTKQ